MEASIKNDKYLFSNKSLYKLILPLIVEQFLLITVGLADTIMTASLGESAVSAVSLVDSIDILIINIFTALATGGAVVAGQYLGQKKEEYSCKSADQLILFLITSSLGVMGIIYLSKYFILHVVFGNIDSDVMNYANTYFEIVFLSVPFISVYNGGAALFRAMGNSKITMKISFLMNLINIAGNYILIYKLKIGIAGAAIPTVFSRFVAAFIICILIKNQDLQIHLSKKMCKKFDFMLIKKILYIGIPNGLENAMFQLGKIIVLNLISTFGTASIAANAVGNSVALFQIIPGYALNQATLSIASQCVGAGDYEQAKFYTRKMLKISTLFMIITIMLTFVGMPLILKWYNLSKSTAQIARNIILYHGILTILIWSISFVLPNTLRAANDVKYCMVIAILSMWIFRIGFSYILGKYMNIGVLGIWIAMSIDWLFRGICFVGRYRGSKWKTHKI